MKKRLLFAVSSIVLFAVFINVSDFYIDFITASENLLSDISSGGEGDAHGSAPTWLIIPFVILQLIGLIIIAIWPGLVTWLPGIVYGN